MFKMLLLAAERLRTKSTVVFIGADPASQAKAFSLFVDTISGAYLGVAGVGTRGSTPSDVTATTATTPYAVTVKANHGHGVA